MDFSLLVLTESSSGKIVIVTEWLDISLGPPHPRGVTLGGLHADAAWFGLVWESDPPLSILCSPNPRRVCPAWVRGCPPDPAECSMRNNRMPVWAAQNLLLPFYICSVFPQFFSFLSFFFTRHCIEWKTDLSSNGCSVCNGTYECGLGLGVFF